MQVTHPWKICKNDRSHTRTHLIEAVERQPAVALIGPRQVGKTPWPLDIAEQRPTVYLDFEAPVEDRYALSQGVAAIGVRELAEELAGS